MCFVFFYVYSHVLIQGRRQLSKNGGGAEDCWGTCKDAWQLFHALCLLGGSGDSVPPMQISGGLEPPLPPCFLLPCNNKSFPYVMQNCCKISSIIMHIYNVYVYVHIMSMTMFVYVQYISLLPEIYMYIHKH